MVEQLGRWSPMRKSDLPCEWLEISRFYILLHAVVRSVCQHVPQKGPLEPQPSEQCLSRRLWLRNGHPFKDSTGGVFESVFRCIGHRQCHEICTLVTPRLFEHRERGAATSMFQSHAYIIIICILWDRLQILQHWAAMPSWLSTQAFVAARDIFHGGASMCFSQQYCSDNAVLSGFSQVPFDHVDHLRYFGDFASKTPIFWHHFPLICCRVFANRAPRHQNGLVYSSIPVTWQ